ncbi:MAG: RNA polymerase sigma factor [Acidimicrobiia bacterium]
MHGGRRIGPGALGEQFDHVLAAARTGAGWAAERLWRTLAPSVAGYLRAQGSAEPDDLTSEVFVGVFRNLGSFAGDEERFRSWVFTIAHRRLLDERRRAARRPHPAAAVADPGRAHAAPEVAPSAEAEALGRLGADGVRRICDRLAADQRDVLVLRLVGGLTVEEVAAAVGKSPGAVKALQRRAVEALRRILQHQGVPL